MFYFKKRNNTNCSSH